MKRLFMLLQVLLPFFSLPLLAGEEAVRLKEAPGKIHRGGANVLYGDGHVNWKHQKELVLYRLDNPSIRYPATSIQWQTIAPQWNNDNKP